MTCPLLVTTVKLGPEPQWIMEAAQSQEQAENAKKRWGLWPWGELGSRSHVRRLSLCRPRSGGEKSAEQSGSTLAPEAPAPSRLGLEALHIAPVSGPVRAWGPWTTAGSRVSVFKASVDSCEQDCVNPSIGISENITLET